MLAWLVVDALILIKSRQCPLGRLPQPGEVVEVGKVVEGADLGGYLLSRYVQLERGQGLALLGHGLDGHPAALAVA